MPAAYPSLGAQLVVGLPDHRAGDAEVGGQRAGAGQPVTHGKLARAQQCSQLAGKLQGQRCRTPRAVEANGQGVWAGIRVSGLLNSRRSEVAACHSDGQDRSMTVSTPLSPTPRTTVLRGSKRAQPDRDRLRQILAAGVVCHLGVLVDGVPRVLPTAYGVNPEGPDRDGTLYVHGSVAARSLVQAPSQTVCAVPRLIDDPAEKVRALDLIVDNVVPGRARTLRAHSRKELAATDVAAWAWAGVVPLQTVAGQPVRSGDCDTEVATPADVLALVG